MSLTHYMGFGISNALTFRQTICMFLYFVLFGGELIININAVDLLGRLYL